MLAAALLLAATPSPPAAAAPAAVPTQLQCRVAAFRVGSFTLLAQGMIENLEKRGVPAERKERYEALKTQVAKDEPLVTPVLERYGYVKPTEAEDAAFGNPDGKRMREILAAC